MADFKTTKEEAAVAIRGMIDHLEAQIGIEDQEFDGDGCDDTLILGEGEADQRMTAKLVLVPESEWANLRVSKNSLFDDVLWDFEDEGSPIYKSHAKVSWGQEVAEGIKLTDPNCEPLRRLLMACLYYYLPQNNLFGYCRSYNSVIPMFRGFVRVGRFLYQQRIFVDVYGNGESHKASTLTADDIARCIEEQPNINAKLSAASAMRFWQDISDAEYLPREYRLNQNCISQSMVRKLRKQKAEGAGCWMPISLEVLATVVPYCVDLIDKHSEEILNAYDFLHPVFANKGYKEKIGFTWGNVIVKLKELNSALWSVDDFRTEDGNLNSLTKQSLISTIRKHPNWPAYQKKHFPKGEKTTSNASTEDFLDIAKEMRIDLADLDAQTNPLFFRMKVRERICSHPEWPKYRAIHSFSEPQKQLNRQPHAHLLNVAKDLHIDLHSVGDGTIPYDLRWIRHVFMGIFTTFRTACEVVLCLVTGMRRSELLHLKADKAWPVPGTHNEFRLEFEVFKTDEASQGATVVIPIPEIAYKAYKALESITKEARQHLECEYVSVNITNNFGQKAHPNVINRRLDELWEDLGVEEDIHPHMFRKTLAMFAIYQDPRNIVVIKHLFSHKSLAMTLAYIVKIPGLSEDIKLAIVKHNADLLAELLTAAKNEKIGGTCGVRIKEQVKSGTLAARLNDEGRESIEQYIESLLEQGLRLLHRCPLSVICTNTHDTVVHISPELCNCEVTNCDYAVFTEASVPALMDELKFHERWIEHPLVSEDQIRFSRRKINDCLDRLAEIQGREAVMAEFPGHYGLVA